MRRAPLVVAAVLAVTPAAAVAACDSSEAGIGTDQVRRATVVEVVDVPASVTARAVATLTTPADATISRIAVEPGRRVRRGAVVAVLDSPAARKRLADARAALAAAGRVGVPAGTVDLSGVQRGLDTAAADAFAAARTAAGKVADAALQDALLAHVDAAQRHYEAVARESRRIQRQVQRGIAGISQAVAALGAAQRAQAQAAYDIARSTVDALTLRAPITGVVQYARPATGGPDPLAGLLDAVGGGATEAAIAGSAAGSSGSSVAGVDDVLAVGDRVGTGDAIVTIVDVSEIGLRGEVDETDVLLVSPGVAADVELDAAPGLRYEATVRSVDLLPTASSRGGVSYRIRLAFAPRTGDAATLPTPRPGMSAVAHLRVRTAENAVSVPAAAVFTSDLGDTVWVVRDGRAQRQRVEIGVQGEDLVEVRAGVAPGERVVVSGTDKVSAGQELP